jgi:rod shape-determining protein MreD
VLIVLACFVILLFQTTLANAVNVGPLMPVVVLPMAIYLGVAPDVRLLRGSLLAFSLGLMQDSMSGNAMGFWTFVCEATFVIARAAGWRIIMRGRLAQVLATAATAVVAGATILALRRIFRTDPPFDVVTFGAHSVAIFLPALTTAAVAPWIFQLMRLLDTFRRRDDGAAIP